jgi:hypothetical protein
LVDVETSLKNPPPVCQTAELWYVEGEGRGGERGKKGGRREKGG